MKLRINSIALAFALIATSGVLALGQGKNSDPLLALKRAISQASAPALTVTQETALTTLITEYRDSLPDYDDEAIETANELLDAAILAGDLAAAQVQITAITTRTVQLQDTLLVADAKLAIGAIEVLKGGGQYTPLVTKYGTDRVLQLVKFPVSRGAGSGPVDGGGRR